MKLADNPINDYLMRMALPLAGWFIVEQLLRYATAQNAMFSLLLPPMMLATPIALYFIVRHLRRTVMGNAISGLQAWSFGTQLMFLAGLIEGLFIYVYNEFIFPGNLIEVQQGVLQQTEEALQAIKSSGLLKGMEGQLTTTLEVMRKAAVPSAIEAAVDQISTDIFQGMLMMTPIALIVRRKPQPNQDINQPE